MVKLLPARGFGAGFAQAFPEAFKQSADRYANAQSEQRTQAAKSLLDIERDRQKILSEEESKDRDFQRFAAFLGVGEEPRAQDQGISREENIAEPTPAKKGALSWETMDPNRKALFSFRYPEVAKELESDLQHRQKLEADKAAIERKPLEKATEQFFTGLSEEAERIPSLELSVEGMLDAIQSGDIDPFSATHFADIAASLGAPEATVRGFIGLGGKEFQSARKKYLSSTLQDTFRGTTSQGQIKLAESLLAEVGAKREANLAATFFLQADLEIRKERQRLAEEAAEKGLSNYDIPKYVNSNIKPFRNEISKDYFEAVKQLRKDAGLK